MCDLLFHHTRLVLFFSRFYIWFCFSGCTWHIQKLDEIFCKNGCAMTGKRHKNYSLLQILHRERNKNAHTHKTNKTYPKKIQIIKHLAILYCQMQFSLTFPFPSVPIEVQFCIQCSPECIRLLYYCILVVCAFFYITFFCVFKMARLVSSIQY